MIEHFAGMIDSRLRERSGKVFYSGKGAFRAKSDLYILGFNPGGDPDDSQEASIAQHTRFVLEKAPEFWSAYADESWKRKAPGRHGLQPRLLHLFKRLGRDLRRTPSSNLIFTRSPRAASLAYDADHEEGLCWPFHREVLDKLGPRIVVCLGDETAKRVRRRLGANTIVGAFVERNNRRWTNRAFRSAQGMTVIGLPHPSIVDWTAPETDPSEFVSDTIRSCS